MAPSVHEMISTHTMAQNIIDRQNTADEILDSNNLALLRRFCDNPAAKDEILRDVDMLDGPNVEPGTRANKQKGSLSGYCIATYGTDKSVLLDHELVLLRNWFAGRD